MIPHPKKTSYPATLLRSDMFIVSSQPHIKSSAVPDHGIRWSLVIYASCEVTVSRAVTIGDMTFCYNDGDTWQTLIDSGKYGLSVGDYNMVCSDEWGYIWHGEDGAVYPSDEVDKYNDYYFL